MYMSFVILGRKSELKQSNDDHVSSIHVQGKN